MLKILTKKLRKQSLSEIHPFQLKVSCPVNDEEDSEDSEGENQELAQIDKERRRNCNLTPLAINQCQNQENQCCKVRTLFHAGLDRHSSEEELERISREFAAEKRKWCQVSRLSYLSDNTSSSDEEVKNLCGMSFRPVEKTGGLHANASPVLFSASPPKRLQPLVRKPASRPLIFASVGASFEQRMPCKRHKQYYGDNKHRPSLDLEKMQQSSQALLEQRLGEQQLPAPPPHFSGHQACQGRFAPRRARCCTARDSPCRRCCSRRIVALRPESLKFELSMAADNLIALSTIRQPFRFAL